jgi:5-methyltetrahydropteroyltriglutamate--homocysteine methyltransferase
MALRTTVVGSWWWPRDRSRELREYHDGQLDPEAGAALLAECAADAIAEQREIGLDEWTGGEFFTDNFLGQLANRLTGLEIVSGKAAEVFDYDDLAHARVVGPITAPRGMGYLEAYEREKSLPGGIRKATVVSPLELTVHASADRDALWAQMPELTAIVNRELRALADAGCPHVQLDAPILGVEVNMGRMTADQAAAMIAPCFEGVNATKGLHLCNGNLKGRPMSGVLRNAPWVDMLVALAGVVDVAALESSYFNQWLERDAFSRLPANMQLAAGIVDEANYWVEPVEKIRSRAEDWARVVGEERLWLAPSCGFGRHPSRDEPVLRAKLENMVAAARSF